MLHSTFEQAILCVIKNLSCVGTAELLDLVAEGGFELLHVRALRHYEQSM